MVVDNDEVIVKRKAKVASLMRFELMRGNVDAFAELLEYHWELSKKVDAGNRIAGVVTLG